MKERFLPRRPSPAMLLAVVALVFSLTGGAIAAGLIGTSDIKKGAVTKKKLHKNAVNSKKVKNKTLKAKDFADGQLEQGVQGIQGLKGDKGDKGDTGARGPSDAYHAQLGEAPNGSGVRLDLDLPAGDYVVFAKLGTANEGGGAVDNVNCSLEPDLDVGFVATIGVGREDQINLQGQFTPNTDSTVSLECPPKPGVKYLRMKIDAIQVETLHLPAG